MNEQQKREPTFRKGQPVELSSGRRFEVVETTFSTNGTEWVRVYPLEEMSPAAWTIFQEQREMFRATSLKPSYE